jgi:hypothetical protein
MRLRVEDVQGRNCLTNFWVSGWGSAFGGGAAGMQQCLLPRHVMHS